MHLAGAAAGALVKQSTTFIESQESAGMASGYSLLIKPMSESGSSFAAGKH